MNNIPGRHNYNPEVERRIQNAIELYGEMLRNNDITPERVVRHVTAFFPNIDHRRRVLVGLNLLQEEEKNHRVGGKRRKQKIIMFR